MRALPVVLALSLVVPLAVGADAGERPALADASEEALRLLSERALRDADVDAVAYATEHVLNASRVPTDDALAAWHAAGDRAGVLAAEAALLDVAARNVHAALAAGDADAARAWLDVARARALAVERDHPDAGADEESVIAALDAALAARAREAIVAAALLQRAGLAADAADAAAGAGALTQVVVTHAAHRLPSALAAPLAENATRVPDVVTELPAERKGHWATGLVAPLVALEYDRDVEALDEMAARNVDAAFTVLRAMREDPVLVDVLAREALLQYDADRGFLFLRGEGTLDAADDAARAIRDAAAGVGNVQDAVLDHRDAVRAVGLLERGIVLKVEVGGARTDREHEYAVTLVRPPLEGLAKVTLRIGFDAGVVDVLGFRARDPRVSAHDTREDGGLTLDVTWPEDAPLRRSAVLGTLRLTGVGEPASESALAITDATFLEPDGDAADVFRLRDGHVTVTVVALQEDEPVPDGGGAVLAGGPGMRGTPSGGAAAAALAASFIALARRRA